MPLKKMRNYVQLWKSWKNNKILKPHLPYPLHPRNLHITCEKNSKEKFRREMSWRKNVWLLRKYPIIGAAAEDFDAEDCTDSITTEVIEMFICARSGEICILIFKSCLLELSHCKQPRHRNGTQKCTLKNNLISIQLLEVYSISHFSSGL